MPCRRMSLLGLAVLLAVPAGAQTFTAGLGPTLIDTNILRQQDYPLASNWRGEMGRVGVVVSISAIGVPTACTVEQPSPFERLNLKTCELFMTRARYAVSGSGPHPLGVWKLSHDINWSIDASEPRPLMFGVRLVSETRLSDGGSYCLFSDNVGVRVAAGTGCVARLGVDEGKTAARGKPVRQSLVERLEAAGDDEVALTALGFLSLRFSYAQWDGLMRRAAELGSGPAAAMLCRVNSTLLTDALTQDERLRFCRISFESGIPWAPDMFVDALFDGRNENRQDAMNKLGRLFRFSALARRHIAAMLIEDGRHIEAAAYLLSAVRWNGDQGSIAALARFFGMKDNPHANALAALAWSRLADGATAAQVAADPAIGPAARGMTLKCLEMTKLCDAGVSGAMEAAMQTVQAVHAYALPEVSQDAQISSADYSIAARRQSISGLSRLFYRIDASGQVDRCYVFQSALLASLDDNACAVIRRRIFSPARLGTEPHIDWKPQDVRWGQAEKPAPTTGMQVVSAVLLGTAP